MWGKYACADISCGPVTGKPARSSSAMIRAVSSSFELTQTFGGTGSHHHASSDSFTVEPVSVTHFGFNRVAKRMPKIQ